MSTARKQKQKILAQLEKEFLAGKRYSIEELVIRFYNPKSRLKHILSTDKVRGWMIELKKRIYETHGLCFGKIDNLGPNEQGRYGLAKTEAEYRTFNVHVYNIGKGINQSAHRWINEAQHKGLLTAPGKVQLKQLSVPETP